MSFPSISPKQSFPALESEVLAFWKANNTFRKSIESRPEDNPYRFYDGPPFITGMPHYGSLLSSIVKDAVGRYWTMRGKRVDRVWGWDCHGLPIEEKVQKKLGLKSNKDIEENGVKNFIDECYNYTRDVSSEWNWYIDKIGRWVDMDNAYRTMDQDYMESVMWVFSELWNKGLIYKGKRVSLYSWKLSTPISNFEVAMDDTYQDVNDPAITVKFELESNSVFPEGSKVLAWTTTPWTIPANMALAVNQNIEYVLIENNGEQYVVAKNRAETVFKGKGEYTIIREFKGSELVGLSYVPPFPEYYHNKFGDKNHKIYHADFATDSDGTGIVHIAPEFGDVDFGLAKKEGITLTEALSNEGRYTEQIFDYIGTHYLDLESPENGANKINVERMKKNGTLFKLEGITHRVPFCPRSGTPLVQKAQDSWFIDIQSQKDKLIEANEQINWFPEYLKEGRFKKGIESAPDWCISRTRFWGAPMPVWVGEDGEQLVVSSRDEIFEYNQSFGQLEKRELEGKTVYFFKGGEFDGIEFNLHKPYIDSIFLKNPKARKAKKVLGIHGWTSRGLNSGDEGFWTHIKETLSENDISFEVPDFDKNKETTYSLWKEKLDNLNVTQYDTYIAHSFGCPVIMQYIIENKIHLDRLILVAPSGMIGNKYLEKIIPEIDMDVSELKKYITEVVIIHSEDDGSDSAKFSYGKTLAEKLGATFIKVNGYNHDFRNNGKSILAGLVQYGSPMTRIPEVLDVWLDSGSMPYAQMHYPFENKEAMLSSFPADFIAEYVGQIRAWFYVMHVLGVLLNPKNETKPTPSFTNAIVTGVVNGNDGRKMSKSFGNYPDPRMAIEKYGADPIRFYMLNSPLLSGGDMDFKEEGIMETIKGVMLPIWNTYSFFTTYANIDKWEKDNTEVWFSRHAESTSNIAGKMSDGSDNPELTEKGREQARNAGKTLRDQGKKFDVIIHTGFTRTIETAQIIGKETGFEGEYITHEGFTEQAAGEYANKTLTEIASMHDADPADHPTLRKYYKNNSTENLEQFEERILGTYKEILEKYKDKKILIIGHAGTSRPVLEHYCGRSREDAEYNIRIINADPFQLMTTPIMNPLDSWILSRLQVLIAQVHDAMDGYDVSRGCRAIVDYMDELTNWYVRLSRRRFWESGMTDDKRSAYETLHTVLVEVSKLLAPLMPFMSENIFQGLTGRESVHLEYVTFANKHLIANDLNRDMGVCEHIVSLGLALRSRKNIRVRQPLSIITITHELSEYYKNIIRDELNVKEVKFENPEKLAKKICKPDARKIGPKYGKDVQKVITEAKNGNFTEKENGIIDVGGFILEVGEYTMEYLPLEGTLDVEGGYGMVVALDTTISDALKTEGYARDIIRTIQDMRKEADYNVTDRIQISLSGEGIEDIIDGFGSMINSETLSRFESNITPDLTKTENIDENLMITIQIAR